MFGSCFKGVNYDQLESIKNYKKYLVCLDKENDRTNQIPILPIIKTEEFGNDNRRKLQSENTDNSKSDEQLVLPPSE